MYVKVCLPSESVTTGQTDGKTKCDYRTDRQMAKQSEATGQTDRWQNKV